jgi:hypothetical protein
VLLGCDTSKMAAEPRPAGVVGKRVAANLRRLRRGTSTYELSRQLAEIGWEIRANGLTRIEAGSRRIDVDDLVALSVVLGCSPNRLLMPEADDELVPLVGNVEATGKDAWAWAAGEKPLGYDRPSPSGWAFIVENQPQHYGHLDPHPAPRHPEHQRLLVEGMRKDGRFAEFLKAIGEDADADGGQG